MKEENEEEEEGERVEEVLEEQQAKDETVVDSERSQKLEASPPLNDEYLSPVEPPSQEPSAEESNQVLVNFE